MLFIIQQNQTRTINFTPFPASKAAHHHLPICWTREIGAFGAIISALRQLILTFGARGQKWTRATLWRWGWVIEIKSKRKANLWGRTVCWLKSTGDQDGHRWEWKLQFVAHYWERQIGELLVLLWLMTFSRTVSSPLRRNGPWVIID